MNKKPLTIPSILLFALIALYSCVLVPVREYFATDIILSDTVWFAIIDLVWMHMGIISSVALLTFVTYGIYRYRLRGSKWVLLITAAALTFKYVAAIVAFSMEYGSLDLTGGLWAFLINFLIELTFIALIVYLAYRFITPRQTSYETKKAAAKKLGRPLEEKPIYPFQRIFSLKNPIQRLLFISVTIVALGQLLADIPQTFRYGIFHATDILVAVISWLVLIILPAVYSYLLSLSFFEFCDKRGKTSTPASEK